MEKFELNLKVEVKFFKEEFHERFTFLSLFTSKEEKIKGEKNKSYENSCLPIVNDIRETRIKQSIFQVIFLFYSFKFIQQKSFFTHLTKNFVLILEI